MNTYITILAHIAGTGATLIILIVAFGMVMDMIENFRD